MLLRSISCRVFSDAWPSGIRPGFLAPLGPLRGPDGRSVSCPGSMLLRSISCRVFSDAWPSGIRPGFLAPLGPLRGPDGRSVSCPGSMLLRSISCRSGIHWTNTDPASQLLGRYSGSAFSVFRVGYDYASVQHFGLLVGLAFRCASRQAFLGGDHFQGFVRTLSHDPRTSFLGPPQDRSSDTFGSDALASDMSHRMHTVPSACADVKSVVFSVI